MKLPLIIEPLQQAIAKLDARTPVGSALRTREWADVPLALRERAMFSAGVESARLLGEMQRRLRQSAAMLRDASGGLVDRSVFISEIRNIAERLGINSQDGKYDGTIRDIRSRKRLGLVFDMNVRDANEYARWKMDQDPAILDEFPAQELIRLESRRVPRQWIERWTGAGGTVRQGRMVALKNSPVWSAISRFGRPWPPFDFGSGMGLRDVSRDEAEALGLIAAGESVQPAETEFNASLKASVTNLPDDIIASLQAAFGDQITVANGRVAWNSRRAA